MKISVITNYTFDKAAGTVTFTDFSTIALNRIISITDMTIGVQIYSYKVNQYTGTVATNVLTLNVDTTGSQFNNSDKLYIEYITDNYGNQIQVSGAQTATGTGSAITNYDAKGASFIINTTAVTGTDTPTMVVKFQMQDIVSSNWVDIPGAVTGNITGTGQTLITLYPGLTVSANSKIDFPLPRIYRAAWTITGTTPSFTFSIGANYIN